MSNLSTHIILVAIMLITIIINLILINSYRKNSIKVYKKITKSEQLSQDNLVNVDQTGKRIQEKFYNLEKLTNELINKIENTMKNDEEYKRFLLKNRFNNSELKKYGEFQNEITKEL